MKRDKFGRFLKLDESERKVRTKSIYSRGTHPNCKKNSPFVKGHKVYPGSEKGQFKIGSKGHLGYKHPEQTKMIMRIKKLKDTTPLKEQIRNSVNMINWRISVFKRDNFTCQVCKKVGCNLEAHHIKSFSKLIEEYNIKTFDEALKCKELWNINNGITLCKECHKLTDSYAIKYKRRND